MSESKKIVFTKTVTAGMARIKTTDTEIIAEDDQLLITQQIKGMVSSKGSSEWNIKKEDITGITVTTKFDMWNTGLAVIAAVATIGISGWLLLCCIPILYLAYGKIATITLKSGQEITIPSKSSEPIDELKEFVHI